MTIHLTTLASLTFLAAVVGAHTPSRTELPKAYSGIREADLRRDVGEMASPAMRGREGGTIDEMRASMWVADQYRQIGLKPLGENGSYFQWFGMTRAAVAVGASRATIGEQPMNLFRNFIPLGVVPA